MLGEDQCAVQWHVGSLKISCRNKKAAETVIGKLKKERGKHSPLTVSHGLVHKHLGVTIDCSKEGKVIFTMRKDANDITRSTPNGMKGTSMSPAGNHPFKTNPEALQSSAEDEGTFHHHVAQLLFLAKRARPDL